MSIHSMILLMPNWDQREMIMEGKIQLNKRKHFQTICRTGKEEVALLGREPSLNLAGSTVYQEAGPRL